ncbi:MAG: helix-turn-helix transcriptional regulator [Deltaproteobacteria bacterium]
MTKSAFDRYVNEQMKSPSFAKAYAAARAEIKTTEQLLRALDAQREQLGLTKAQLARRAGMEPAALRRLFTSEDPNPTFSTITTLLAELDLRLVVVGQSAASKNRAPQAAGPRAASRVKRPARIVHA